MDGFAKLSSDQRRPYFEQAAARQGISPQIRQATCIRLGREHIPGIRGKPVPLAFDLSDLMQQQ